MILSHVNVECFQLPDKSISSLVKYYYSWKKTRSRTSLMDRQARKLANRSHQGDRYHTTSAIFSVSVGD